MKFILTFILALFLICVLISPLYSQDYIKVTATQKWNNNDGESFDNVYLFEFNPSAYDYYEYKKCKLSFQVFDNDGNALPEDHLVRAFTGFKREFLEAEEKTNSIGYVELNLATNNISNLAIVVCYNGTDYNAVLRNVHFEYSGKKY